MGDAMMDFLFASQDASTASLTWAIHYMSEQPALLARVRAEQAAVRPNGEPLTYELLEQMTYARCVVKVRTRGRRGGGGGCGTCGARRDGRQSFARAFHPQ